MDPDQPPSEDTSEVYRETGATASRVFAPIITRRIIRESTANPWSAPSRRFAGDSQGRRIRGRFVWRGLICGAVYQPHGAVAPTILCDHGVEARGSCGALASQSNCRTCM